MRYIFLLLFVFSCGYQVEQTGEGKIKVDIALTFVSEITQICKDSFLLEDFENVKLYNQAVATCVLDTLSVLDLSWLYGMYGEEL